MMFQKTHIFTSVFMQHAGSARIQSPALLRRHGRSKSMMSKCFSYHCSPRMRLGLPNAFIAGSIKLQRPFISDNLLHSNLELEIRSTTISFCSLVKEPQFQNYVDAQNKNIYDILQTDMQVIPNFLSEEEEESLLEEVDRYMKRLRYEYDHWDNAIHGFRETERKSWNATNQVILERVRTLAFHSEVSPLAYVHVLDISKDGYIKPHVDAVRFCGDTITGMSLLSSCVMRLALEKDPSMYGDVYLPQRSLYIMKNKARYDFTHEVLKEEESKFKGQVIPRDRRISIICRNEPNPEDTQ